MLAEKEKKYDYKNKSDFFVVMILRKKNEIPNIHPIKSKWLREFDEIGMGYEIMLLRRLLMWGLSNGIRVN